MFIKKTVGNLELSFVVLIVLMGVFAQACTQVPQTVDSSEEVFRVAMQPIVQTDPALISSDSEVLIANHVFDYLIDIDAQNNVIPRLAWDWTVSEDGKRYTFTIEEGVRFHDGWYRPCNRKCI